MSLEAMLWAIYDAPDVPRECLSVLIALGERARKDGSAAYPGLKLLTSMTRKTERQVRYDLRTLEKLGLIREGDPSHVRKYPVYRRPMVYDLAMERKRPPSEGQPTAPQSGGQLIAEGQSTAPGQPAAPRDASDLQEPSGGQSTAPPLSDLRGGNTASSGGQSTAPNTSSNPKSKPSSRPRRDLNEGREDAMRVCVHLADRINDRIGERPKISKEWLDSARLMLDTDNRSEDQVHKAIDWCQGNDFWHKNVLSLPTLRKRYLRLRAEAVAEQANRNGRGPGAAGDRSRGWVDAGQDFQEMVEGQQGGLTT